jgi:hypothetical protein
LLSSFSAKTKTQNERLTAVLESRGDSPSAAKTVLAEMLAFTPLSAEHAAPGDMLHLDIKRLVRIQRPSHRVTGNRRDSVKGIGAEFLPVWLSMTTRASMPSPTNQRNSRL